MRQERRADGTNPRAKGRSPRQMGVNARALKVNPRALDHLSPEQSKRLGELLAEVATLQHYSHVS